MEFSIIQVDKRKTFYDFKVRLNVFQYFQRPFLVMVMPIKARFFASISCESIALFFV